MKKTILCTLVALVAAIAPASSWAFDTKEVSSKVSGFSCRVPESAAVLFDKDDAVGYYTADQGFVISAIPADGDKLTTELIGTVVTAMADNVGLNFEKADTLEFKNEVMEGVVYVQNKDNGEKVGVGLIGLAEGNQGFFITMLTNGEYSSGFDEMLNSIKYDGTAVEVKPQAKKQPAATKAKRRRK